MFIPRYHTHTWNLKNSPVDLRGSCKKGPQVCILLLSHGLRHSKYNLIYEFIMFKLNVLRAAEAEASAVLKNSISSPFSPPPDAENSFLQKITSAVAALTPSGERCRVQYFMTG